MASVHWQATPFDRGCFEMELKLDLPLLLALYSIALSFSFIGRIGGSAVHCQPNCQLKQGRQLSHGRQLTGLKSC